MKRNYKKAVIWLIWLCLWQIAALFIHNPIYFASPPEVAAELLVKAGDLAFWQSVGASLLRIMTGFFGAFILAFFSAFISFRHEGFGDFIAPAITFLKSVPVAAVTVIMLIWWGPRYLVFCISMMVVFPNIYANMLTGLQNTNAGLLEMADVFKLRFSEKFLWIYRPAYLPYLHSAVKVALGMGFKSGIAAEIIGLPEFSMGEMLYRDKIYLNTAGVFAWILVILLISTLTELLIIYVLTRLSKVPDPCPENIATIDTSSSPNSANTLPDPSIKGNEEYTVYSERIQKSYGAKLITDTSLHLMPGHIYYLKAPSGAGKTTLLKMIAGILTPDLGTISHGQISMVFQEDYLIEHANALRNLQLAGCTGDLKKELLQLLSEETLLLPASALSGGERRRLAIARALLVPSEIVLMDEPFAGLDEDTKKRSIDWILSHLEGRTLLFSAHETETISTNKGEMIPLVKVG